MAEQAIKPLCRQFAPSGCLMPGFTLNHTDAISFHADANGSAITFQGGILKKRVIPHD